MLTFSKSKTAGNSQQIFFASELFQEHMVEVLGSMGGPEEGTYMSLFQKAKKAKENKNGFTLVELIVVLVILAILAAVLVPTMTKWIDKANEKQVVIDARTAYLAAQTVVSEQYGLGNTIEELNFANDTDSDDVNGEAAELADISGDYSASFTVTSNKVEAGSFTKGGFTAILANGTWTVEKSE